MTGTAFARFGFVLPFLLIAVAVVDVLGVASPLARVLTAACCLWAAVALAVVLDTRPSSR